MKKKDESGIGVPCSNYRKMHPKGCHNHPKFWGELLGAIGKGATTAVKAIGTAAKSVGTAVKDAGIEGVSQVAGMAQDPSGGQNQASQALAETTGKSWKRKEQA